MTTTGTHGRCGARLLLLFAVLSGCASVPDRFYALNAAAPGVATPGGGPATAAAGAQPTPVHLVVTVPPAVDRSEMVLETGSNGVTIFEHERWAAPLAGQVQRILGRDLEAHSAGLIVGDRALGAAATAVVVVDLVRMTARLGEAAVIEAQWRIQDAGGADRLGSAVFSAGGRVDTVAGLPASYSAVLDLLAQRLAQEMSRR